MKIMVEEHKEISDIKFTYIPAKNDLPSRRIQKPDRFICDIICNNKCLIFCIILFLSVLTLLVYIGVSNDFNIDKIDSNYFRASCNITKIEVDELQTNPEYKMLWYVKISYNKQTQCLKNGIIYTKESEFYDRKIRECFYRENHKNPGCTFYWTAEKEVNVFAYVLLVLCCIIIGFTLVCFLLCCLINPIHIF